MNAQYDRTSDGRRERVSIQSAISILMAAPMNCGIRRAIVRMRRWEEVRMPGRAGAGGGVGGGAGVGVGGRVVRVGMK